MQSQPKRASDPQHPQFRPCLRPALVLHALAVDGTPLAPELRARLEPFGQLVDVEEKIHKNF